jgi:hypothetical protein
MSPPGRMSPTTSKSAKAGAGAVDPGDARGNCMTCCPGPSPSWEPRSRGRKRGCDQHDRSLIDQRNRSRSLVARTRAAPASSPSPAARAASARATSPSTSPSSSPAGRRTWCCSTPTSAWPTPMCSATSICLQPVACDRPQKGTLAEVMVRAPGGFRLIGGASGLARMADLSDDDRQRLVDRLANSNNRPTSSSSTPAPASVPMCLSLPAPPIRCWW